MTNEEWLNWLDTDGKAEFLANVQQNGSVKIVPGRIHERARYVINKIWELWLKSEHKE